MDLCEIYLYLLHSHLFYTRLIEILSVFLIKVLSETDQYFPYIPVTITSIMCNLLLHSITLRSAGLPRENSKEFDSRHRYARVRQ